LAREAAANKVNWFKIVSSDISHVSISGYTGPVLGKSPIAEIIKLDLPLAGHSRPFEAKVKATYASEQAAKGKAGAIGHH